MRPIPSDAYSASAALVDRAGLVTVAYLNVGPETRRGPMGRWPRDRLASLRNKRYRSVHEEDHATGLHLRGGTGACVMDDYVTRRKAHHYREIACLVRGHSPASVIVAAALVSAWPQYGSQLVRAIDAWQVH